MSSTFYALPLENRGESFLLKTKNETEEVSILVDVGDKIKSKSKTLSQTIGHCDPYLKNIDKLIITHEDSDHCGGAQQFICEWTGNGNSIREIWLPALWFPAVGIDYSIQNIISGLSFFQDVFYEKVENISDKNRYNTKTNNLTKCNYVNNARFFHIDSKTEDYLRKIVGLNSLFSPVKFSENKEETIKNTPPSNRGLSYENFNEKALCEAENFLLHYPLKAALLIHERISVIIKSCIKHQIPIRWFDHLPFQNGSKPTGGDYSFLTPVNAIEVTTSNHLINPEMMLMALALSLANRNSLVFLRHATEDDPGVLFTADSPLRTKEKPFPRPTGLPKSDKRLLVTAPHHGSKSNTAAYSVLSNWLGSNYPPLFVQNGGRSVKKTADEFKKARDHQCVRCINSPLPPNLVQYKARKNSWNIPSPMSPPCTCP